eukprot:13804465-Alexandrium_andersonii.AAC.1
MPNPPAKRASRCAGGASRGGVQGAGGGGARRGSLALRKGIWNRIDRGSRARRRPNRPNRVPPCGPTPTNPPCTPPPLRCLEWELVA